MTTSKPERYRLAEPAKRIPMPDRGGRLFSPAARGEAVDAGNRYYAGLIADGDIVPATPTASETKPPAATARPATKRTPTAKGERA